MSDYISVACCLSDVELHEREATLLAQFKSALVATEELGDGYAFRVPGEKTPTDTENQSNCGVKQISRARHVHAPFRSRMTTAVEPEANVMTPSNRGQAS